MANPTTLSSDEIIDKIALLIKPESRRRLVGEIRLHHMLMQGGWRDHPTRIAYVKSLTDSELGSLGLSIVIGRAEDKIRKTVDTLREKGFHLDQDTGHTLDGSDLADGLLHRLNDSRGREAFRDAFNSKFWSTPVVAKDLTLKDDLEILPVDLREANFGKPTKKPVGVV